MCSCRDKLSVRVARSAVVVADERPILGELSSIDVSVLVQRLGVVVAVAFDRVAESASSRLQRIRIPAQTTRARGVRLVVSSDINVRITLLI